MRTPTVRRTRNFYHVTIDGREIAVSPNIGQRWTEADAIEQATRIAAALRKLKQEAKNQK